MTHGQNRAYALVAAMDAALNRKIAEAIEDDRTSGREIQMVIIDEIGLPLTEDHINAFIEYGQSQKMGQQGGEFAFSEKSIDYLLDEFMPKAEVMSMVTGKYNPPHGHAPYHIDNSHKLNAKRKR